ncbi:type II secretion system F family protein [Candidatus Woesearchaeota archaeon]|jgi:pilus assembly protein TadC|nr:type II secretion system F family protein [Candidatus Woesearchaeota archaeon]MBT5111536.1 type II secretion system F family protein [Candidatus Woesearchaeota archaeon]MBT5558050.1 type II secretion system F family protein [Candidatus Woesearchaeota archaeon]MBT6761044.1 type II secretion system F family protein [Candidatus Woesearchaeota archaeon]
MVRAIARIYPLKVRKSYKQLLLYANISTPLEKYLTGVFIGSLIAGLVLTLFLSLFLDFSPVLLYIFSFFISQLIVHSWLSLNADSRGKFVEDLLPDLLQLMASNLRAGYTIDKALILAARPEFGSFRDEINRTGKEVSTGKDFNEALIDLSSRIKSSKLEKSVRLIVAGQKSGGSLVDLLSQSATNLRQQKMIDDRIRSNVLVYVIFIFAAIGFGAPVLFSLSSFLIDIMKNVFSQVTLPDTTGSIDMPISFSEVTITPEFIMQYTILSMIISSVMGSMIIGLISKGKKQAGLKYIPILITLTISLFFIVRSIISGLLGGLFTI